MHARFSAARFRCTELAMAALTAIIMAAGQGTRMKSPIPKVLHEAAGRPLLFYPIQAALDAGAERVIVVVNPQTAAAIQESVQKHFPSVAISFATQEVPRGTGDAVRAGLAAGSWGAGDQVLILSGDTPLLRGRDVQPILERVRDGHLLSFLSFFPPDATGYGRVLRDAQGQPSEIREERDLRSDEEREVREVNAGMYAVQVSSLREALANLSPNNAQGEYYLTDIVALLSGRGPISAQRAEVEATQGVNHLGELAQAEEVLFARIREHWAREGVTLRGRPLIDEQVTLEAGVVVEDGVRLRGRSHIAAGARLDVGVVVDEGQVGCGAVIKPYSVIVQSTVGEAAQVGPFAHLRPGSRLEERAHVGNFVETKNSHLHAGAKVNHLSYVGDGDIGEGANLGAGTIFCNYDGFQKQRTKIGARAFIGSDSQLVAPVEVGEDAYVATGTTVTRDVPPRALAIGRSRQENKDGYGELLRKRLLAQAAEKKKLGV